MIELRADVERVGDGDARDATGAELTLMTTLLKQRVDERTRQRLGFVDA
jgi:hypothetical protein